jgi:mannose-1-phosphate guanylyltransferase/mannose-6-phosphate isomerase
VADVGDEFFIPKGETQRMSCPGSSPCRVLEIAFGEFDDEDIERLSDDYGRIAD